jgi:hypothetical protein
MNSPSRFQPQRTAGRLLKNFAIRCAIFETWRSLLAADALLQDAVECREIYRLEQIRVKPGRRGTPLKTTVISWHSARIGRTSAVQLPECPLHNSLAGPGALVRHRDQ